MAGVNVCIVCEEYVSGVCEYVWGMSVCVICVGMHVSVWVMFVTCGMGERCVCVCVSVVFVGRNPQAGSLSPNPHWGPAGTRTHRIMILSIGPKGRKRQGDSDPPGAPLGTFFIKTKRQREAGLWAAASARAEPSPGRVRVSRWAWGVCQEGSRPSEEDTATLSPAHLTVHLPFK